MVTKNLEQTTTVETTTVAEKKQEAETTTETTTTVGRRQLSGAGKGTGDTAPRAAKEKQVEPPCGAQLALAYAELGSIDEEIAEAIAGTRRQGATEEQLQEFTIASG